MYRSGRPIAPCQSPTLGQPDDVLFDCLDCPLQFQDLLLAVLNPGPVLHDAALGLFVVLVLPRDDLPQAVQFSSVAALLVMEVVQFCLKGVLESG